MFITDLIVELGYATREQVDEAITRRRAAGRSPQALLLETQVITTDQLARAIAERFGLDHVDLNAYHVDMGAVNLLSVRAARRYGAVPVAFVDDETLLVAMSDPTNVAGGRRHLDHDRPERAASRSPPRRTSRP